MVKTYFNTKTFDGLLIDYALSVTTDPKEASLLVLGAQKVDYEKFSNLKAVYRFGVGTENVDFELLKERSIPIYFPGEGAKAILYESTADFTVYGILYLLFKNAFGDIEKWTKTKRDYVGNLTALVIGTGNIGRRVAKKLNVFMKVATYDIADNKPKELEPLVRCADILTVHIPLEEDTKGYFDKEKLGWIKDKAIVVNTARGGLFDEDALYEKLKTTGCRAFFDVFWEEPYHGKLKGLGPEKFFMTPHSASNIRDLIEESFKDILKIVKELER